MLVDTAKLILRNTLSRSLYVYLRLYAYINVYIRLGYIYRYTRNRHNAAASQAGWPGIWGCWFQRKSLWPDRLGWAGYRHVAEDHRVRRTVIPSFNLKSPGRNDCVPGLLFLGKTLSFLGGLALRNHAFSFPGSSIRHWAAFCQTSCLFGGFDGFGHLTGLVALFSFCFHLRMIYRPNTGSITLQIKCLFW